MSSLADLLVSYKQVHAPKKQQSIDISSNRYFDYLNNIDRVRSKPENTSEQTTEQTTQEPKVSWVYKPTNDSIPSTSSSSEQVTYSPNLTRNNSLNGNAKYAYNYFTANGLSKAAAAGIVGNLYHENLANPSQTINDSRGTTALGIAGFNSKGDLPNLQKWCRQNGLRETDFDAQLAYLTHVVKSGRVDLNDPKLTPEQASFIFGRDFERFAGRDGTGRGYKNYDDPEHKKRRGTALKIFNTYGESKN